MLVAAPPGDVSPGKELGHFSNARLCKRGHAQTEDSEAVGLGEVATQQLKDFFIMTAFVKAPPPLTDLKFEQMTRHQKVIFIMKVTACIATFGFAFPTVSSD